MKKRGKLHSKIDLANKLNLPKKEIILIPASYWKRTLAFFIDLLVIDLIIVSPFRKIFESFFSSDISFATASAYFESNPQILSQVTWIIFMISILGVMYFSILQTKMRQTLGMMLFNLWVYTDDKNLSLWKAILSNLTFIPIFPFIVLWILDPVFLLFSGSRQRLMQRFTNIYIVEEAQLGYKI